MDAVIDLADFLNDRPLLSVALVVVSGLCVTGCCVFRDRHLRQKLTDGDDGIYREGGQKTRIRHEGGI